MFLQDKHGQCPICPPVPAYKGRAGCRAVLCAPLPPLSSQGEPNIGRTAVRPYTRIHPRGQGGAGHTVGGFAPRLFVHKLNV
jgi:hypothetical protein